MAAQYYFLALLFAAAHHTDASQEKFVETISERDVSVVNRNNVQYLIDANRILLIMCYVPWDPAYLEKIGDYEKFAKAAFQATEDVTLAKLDMASESAAAAAVDVREEDGLQFVFYRKGVSYNFPDYPDGKALAKKLKTITNPAWTPPEVPILINRVKEMDKKDFVNDLPTKAFAVVLFYKPRSLASQRLLHDFEIAVSALKLTNGIKQSFFKFDVEREDKFLENHEIKALPALKTFRNGKEYDYNGLLSSAKDMTAYMTRHMEAPFTTIPDPQELDVFLKKNADRSTVVGFFASLTLASFPHFVEAAQNLRDRYNFVLMSTPMLSNGDGSEPVQAPGWTLAVFLPKRHHTPDDEKRSVLQYEGASYQMIIDFIKWKATPLAGERTRVNKDTAYPLRPLVVVYGKIDWTAPYRKETEYLRDKVASAAKDHKDILFAISDSMIFQDEMSRFGFDNDSKYDVHVGIFGKDGEYYPRWDTAHMSAKMIAEFARQYKEGGGKPFYRSNITSALLNSDFGLTELTGDNFKSEILDSSSDAIILFYHPLAKHWRLQQSVLKDLAKDIGYKRENVIFAEMDASTNDAPAIFPLHTFPVIYFVSKNDKLNPVRLSGDFCGEYGIRQFVKEQIERSVIPKDAPAQAEESRSSRTEL